MHLVVGGGEDGFVDGVDEGGAAHLDFAGAFGDGHGGVGGGVHAGKAVLALAGDDVDGEVGGVDVEGEGDVVEGFEDIQQHLGGHGDLFGVFHAAGLDGHVGHERGGEVGGFDGEVVFLEMEVKTTDYGHGVGRGKNSAEGLQLLEQLLTVDNKFHILGVLNYSYFVCKDTNKV